MNDKELVQIGLDWFAKSKTIGAIEEFYWNIDQAKVASRAPEIIATQPYGNRSSMHSLKSSFALEKEITCVSTFSHEHGLNIKAGGEIRSKAGFHVWLILRQR
jgi:hypothetical protein